MICLQFPEHFIGIGLDDDLRVPWHLQESVLAVSTMHMEGTKGVVIAFLFPSN